MQITPITRPCELDQIREAWQILEGQRQPRNPFLTWEFIRLWWHHYGQRPGHRLCVLAGFEQGQLVGVAPCYLQSREQDLAAIDCLCFIGDNRIAPDFLDFVTAPEHTAAFMLAAARYIETQCHGISIELNGISDETANDPSWQIFRNRLGLDPEFFDACPWMRLPADVSTYTQSLSPGWRHSLERKRRRLARDCPYRFEVLSGWDAVRNLERFIVLNQERLRERKLDGGFVNRAFRAFHQDLAAALAPLDMIELHLLRAESGEDIAGNYFLKDPESKYYYYYQQGFARQFGVYSPGNILTARSIESATSRSAVEFHFLRGEEPYKYRWAQASRAMVSLQGFIR